MKPSYGLAFTFLGCSILYIASKLPEYLKNDLSIKFINNNNALEKHNEDTVANVILNEDKNESKGNRNDVRHELVSLEKAIQTQEAKEVNGQYYNNSLVRKRRFLIFPDGSSIQVVFCNTYFTMIPIADIFYMGATASLAWELPQDATVYTKHKKNPEKRKDNSSIIYTNLKGSNKMNNWGNQILVNRITGELIQPFVKKYYEKYHGKPKKVKKMSKKEKKAKLKSIKPVFAKRSIEDNGDGEKDRNETKMKKKKVSISPEKIDKMHREQEYRKYADVNYMDESVVDFHRSSRLGLFEKLEKLIKGVGLPGKECVLKALCEIGQDLNGKQGTFLEEIFKAVLRLPKNENHSTKDYDIAHKTKYKCEDIYSKCSYSLKDFPMK